jgi:hypothetical protein
MAPHPSAPGNATTVGSSIAFAFVPIAKDDTKPNIKVQRKTNWGELKALRITIYKIPSNE